ncbi:MAG: DUF115 domain-containing protein [Treponema sp.]|nr:DUF115 domain-containing protein [Treponema sp.]
MTGDNNFFNINLASLSKTNTKLYLQLKNYQDNIPSNHYTFIQSRTGETVPVKNDQLLHSAIDPKREAQRLVSSVTERQNTFFLIFLGLGGGFSPEAALELTDSIITIIDFDIAGIAELFSSKDYSHLINNDRVSFLIDPSGEEIKEYLINNFIPALYDGIKTIPLRTRTENDRLPFDSVIKNIQEAIDIISGDYSVQAHFGKRWYSNIIRQLANNENPLKNNSIIQGKIENANFECAIIAAGPSLDIQIKTIAEMKSKGVLIISSDTAFPALTHNNIEPDLIVSIDCQHISYYHFLNFKPRSIPLILDIASPPLLSRLSETPVFFASNHPLARHIAQINQLPLLDTSGANVTYACLSLAELLGAKRITLFAADFSYVNSQSYARGTYIYPYFLKRQNRFSTAETLFSKFLYRSPFVNSVINKDNKYYETSSLRFYRKKLEEKVSLMQADVLGTSGMGTSFSEKKEKGIIDQKAENKNQTTKKREQIKNGVEILIEYKENILALPLAQENENYIKKINNEQLQIFYTLLPYAAFIRKQNPAIKIKEIIEEVKRCSILEIEKFL